MTSSGTCPIGTATSVGLATISLRGSVVIIVNNLAAVPYASPAPKEVDTFPSVVVRETPTLSSNASNLLRSVGVS